MRTNALALALVAALIVGGCEIVGLGPQASCARAAADYTGTVMGAFSTTVGAVRNLEPRQSNPARWPDLAADHPAVLCYIDATIAKGPPPGPNGEVRDPFDRIVVGIVDGTPEMIMAGYQTNVPVRAP